MGSGFSKDYVGDFTKLCFCDHLYNKVIMTNFKVQLDVDLHNGDTLPKCKPKDEKP